MLDSDEGRSRRWQVAVVAQDAKKAVLAAFARRHREQFQSWDLRTTASVAEMLREQSGARVPTVLPDPRGGEGQLGAEITAGELDALIYLRDPLASPAREPDVEALLRLADLHNVAVATNLASAECLVRALAPLRR